MENTTYGGITIKVVGQRNTLDYNGTRAGNAPLRRMDELLGVTRSPKEGNQTTEKSSVSHELYRADLVGKPDAVKNTEIDYEPAPMKLATEATLAYFASLEDEASSQRKIFFEKVEEGKKALAEKYGNGRVPNSEIIALAASLKKYSVRIWKYQIQVTRTQDTPFKGSRQTRDGRYTATVKSKTIYRMVPLTASEIENLKKVLLGELEAPTRLVASRYAVNGFKAVWVDPHSGVVKFTEDFSQQPD